MSTTLLHAVGYMLVLLTPLSAVAADGREPATRPAETPADAATSVPTDAEIRRAVRMLNHPSQARRREAIKQLCGWGPIAFPELRRAVQEGNLETALSARDVLAELENAILIGARVGLSVDRARVAWDEPFALSVSMTNPTGAVIRAPWPAREVTTQPAIDDAGQVAAMLDVADFLQISAADGHELELRIDPITDDPAVNRAVHRRIGEDPPSHEVKAGRSSVLTVPAFNRGWARFLLLRKGDYTIRFVYQPEWSDPSWTAEGFGRVVSEPIEVEVTDEAPKVVQEAKVPVALRLVRDEDKVTARLVNTWDRPVWINLNRSAMLNRDAVMKWLLLTDADDPVMIVPRDDGAIPPFSTERIRKLDVGRTLDVESWPVERLREVARPNLPKQADQMKIAASYTNILDMSRLRRYVAEAGREMPEARTIFTGLAAAEPITLPMDDTGE